MRALLAAAAVLLVLLTAVAPHTHEGSLGRHACIACVAAGGEEAGRATIEVVPQLVVEAVLAAAPEPPVTGAPLGAIPGQSPPAA